MKGNELDFSFSGLKTAVLRWTEQRDIKAEIEVAPQAVRNPTIEELPAATPQATLDLLASFQHTVIEELLTARGCRGGADWRGIGDGCRRRGLECRPAPTGRAIGRPQFLLPCPSLRPTTRP